MGNSSQALRQRIKNEARISGSDEWNITVDGIINELIQAHSRTERYYENLHRNQSITLTDGVEAYDLPNDFADVHQVWWSNDQTKPRQRTLKAKNDYVEESRGTGAEPRYYELAGTQILIYPYAGILSASHDLRLDYYKSPTLLTGDTDVFAISKLIPVIIREGVARMLRVAKDYQGSQLAQGDAMTVAKAQQTTEENIG